MNLLAVNSSHELLSVALNQDGAIAVAERMTERNHNQFVLVLVDEVLAMAGINLQELDCIACGEGPGSFTGLRIATGVVQGFAYGLDIPTIAVSCLAAVAQADSRNRNLAVLDAKGGRVFWGAYEKNADGIATAVVDDKLSTIEEIAISGKGWHGVGNGWDQRSGELLEFLDDSIDGWTAEMVPHAREVAIIGKQMFAQNRIAPNSPVIVPKYLHPYFAGKI